MTKRKTKVEFELEANYIHNNKYNYDEFDYINSKVKGKIKCNILEHGYFLQSPNMHLSQKNGCPECKKTTISKKLMFTQKQFEDKCFEIHGNKYLYTKYIFIGFKNKGIIICSYCDGFEFMQRASDHITNRAGCPKCATISRRLIMATSKEDFLKKCFEVHGDKFTYDKFVYINNRTPGIITCKVHGDFLQTAEKHLSRGDGCVKCSNKVSKVETEWLDYLGIKKEYRQYKILSIHGRVDGFCPITNTVFEYYGDYYHGNPKFYNPDDINGKSKRTYGELYNKTLEKENKIKKLGFKLITIWHSDWLKYKKENGFKTLIT